MAIFDDRERGFESKYAHAQETAFKVMGRRNRLLGEWAGALLGHSGAGLADYAREVVRSDFEETGEEDVFRKVSRDLEGKATEAEVRAKMHDLIEEARRQVQAGG